MPKKKLSKSELPLLTKVIRSFEEADQRASEAQNTINQNIKLQQAELFPKIEAHYEKARLISYIARFTEGCGIADNDIPAIGSMLGSMGTVPNLLLMIHSPGGNGEIAEKIVDMCRNHCSDTFRVIVPNRAKSAATLITFGADSIVMGYCSELGAIDPQIVVYVGNVPQQISALSVIQARNAILKAITDCKAKGEDFTGYLAQLNTSTMEPAWIRECERQIAFSHDFTEKWLSKFMLKKMNPGWSDKQLKDKANEIAKSFTSADERWSHGRMIGREECKKVGLNVEFVEENTPLWQTIFEIYTRCDYLLGQVSRHKIILTSDSLLIA